MTRKTTHTILCLLFVVILNFNLLKCVEDYTFEQRQDHFNPENQRVFTQRFWVSTKFYNQSLDINNESPILLYLSNFCDPNIDLNTGAIGQWSNELNAIGVELEVRYSSGSQPVKNFTSFQLQFQTIEQNIADVIQFLDYFNSNFPTYSDKQWIIIGEYLQGSTAIWVREKNEKLVSGAIAIAAPVYAHTDFSEYQKFFSNLAGKECAQAIHNATTYTENYLLENENSNLMDLFGCPDIDDDPQFFYVVAQLIEFGLSSYRDQVCANMTSVGTNAEDLVSAYAYTISTLLTLSGVPNCSDWNLAYDTSTVIGNEFADYRPTYYLDCTSLGQFETVGEEGPEVIISKYLTTEWYLSICVELFGTKIPVTPTVNITNLTYGGKDPWGSNYAFVSTTTNPFHFLSVNQTSLPMSIAIRINTTHTFWEFIRGNNSGDNIMNGRTEVLSLMKEWLNLSSPSPSSTPLPPSNSGGDSDSSGANIFIVAISVISLFTLFVLIMFTVLAYYVFVVKKQRGKYSTMGDDDQLVNNIINIS